MDAKELYRTVKQQPFEPVRLFVSDGSHYDIHHPDQIIIAERSCYIGIGRNGEGPVQEIARVANIHITRLEPLRRQKTRRKS
jgi:hypothetical protein